MDGVYIIPRRSFQFILGRIYAKTELTDKLPISLPISKLILYDLQGEGTKLQLIADSSLAINFVGGNG